MVKPVLDVAGTCNAVRMNQLLTTASLRQKTIDRCVVIKLAIFLIFDSGHKIYDGVHEPKHNQRHIAP